MAFLRKKTVLTQLPKLRMHAESFTTLHQAADFRLCLLQAIAQAQHRIYITTLYMEHDEAGQEVLDALFAAKLRKQTLDIRVMVDWHRAQRGRIGEHPGTCNATWYRTQALRNSLEVPIYGIPVQTRELFGVLHLKGVIIDDQVLYSGASINNFYLHKQDKYRFDRYHLIRNQALADAMTRYINQEFFNDPAVFRLDKPAPTTRSIRKEIRAFRDKIHHSQYQIESQTGGEDELAISPIIGVGNGNVLNRVILELIAHAENSLFICTPYFNFPRALVLAISKALQRGVCIDIVVGDKTANDFYIPPCKPFRIIGALPYLYEMNLRRFAKRQQHHISTRNLRVHQWKDGENTYHLKGIFSDQYYMLLTGNNLNPRAFRLDMENALLISDPKAELKEQNKHEQENILRHCRLLLNYQELGNVHSYPEQIKKLLTRLSRVRIDRMLNLML